MRKLRSSCRSGLLAGLLCLTSTSWAVENTLAEYEHCALSQVKDGVASLEAIKKYCSREYSAYADSLPDEYREDDLRRLDTLLRKTLKLSKKRED